MTTADETRFELIKFSFGIVLAFEEHKRWEFCLAAISHDRLSHGMVEVTKDIEACEVVKLSFDRSRNFSGGED